MQATSQEKIEEFFNAISRNDFWSVVILSLKDQNSGLTNVEYHSKSALNFAIEKNDCDEEIIAYLIKIVDINQQDKDGNTALHNILFIDDYTKSIV